MKSPNWTPEELKLALELYLDRDMKWHSKISNKTWEIIALSELLKGLDVIKADKDDKFRSPSSIRLKLANFKSLDVRYGNSSLSNVGNQDKAIWNQYHGDYSSLKAECRIIIETHFKRNPSNYLIRYLERFDVSDKENGENEKIALRLIEMAQKLRNRAINIDDIDFSQKIMDECYDIIKGIRDDRNLLKNTEDDCEKKSHAGINQKEIKKEKIGKYVKRTIARLIEEKKLDEEIISSMQKSEWSREILHLGHPFMLRITDEKDLSSQLTDENGYVRYWKDVFVIEGKKYCFCKEWYETQRKYFETWLSEFESKNKIALKQEDLVRILLKIKSLDEKKICIRVDDIKHGMEDVVNIDKTIEKLLDIKVLAKFQGSLRELVVEDYDLLYAMINNPEMYVYEENKNEFARY